MTAYFLIKKKTLQENLKLQHGGTGEAASSPAGGCWCYLQEGKWALTPPWGVQKPSWAPLCPSPGLGTSHATTARLGQPLRPTLGRDRACKGGAAKDAEPCRCIRVGGDAASAHREVRRGLLHHPPFFNTTAAWHCVLFGF